MDSSVNNKGKAEERLRDRLKEISHNELDRGIFIDTTLISRAEYQLFLDECFDDERSLLPDHVKEPRFIGGMNEPVLGVRPSDAVKFCKWLSQRENNSVSFRLPTEKEIQDPQFITRLQTNERYWIIDNNQFAINQVAPTECVVSYEMLKKQYGDDRARALSLRLQGDRHLKDLNWYIFRQEVDSDIHRNLAFDLIDLYSYGGAFKPPIDGFDAKTFRYNLESSINYALKKGDGYINNAISLTTILPKNKANALYLLRRRNEVLLCFLTERSSRKKHHAEDDMASWFDEVQESRRWYIRHLTLLIHLYYFSFSVNPFFSKQKKAFLDIFISFANLEARISGMTSPCEGILIIKDINKLYSNGGVFESIPAESYNNQMQESANNERIIGSQNSDVEDVIEEDIGKGQENSLQTTKKEKVFELLKKVKSNQYGNPLASNDLVWDALVLGVGIYIKTNGIKEVSCCEIKDQVSKYGYKGWQKFWELILEESNHSELLQLINPIDPDFDWFIAQVSELALRTDNAKAGTRFILSEINQIILIARNNVSGLLNSLEDIKPQNTWNDLRLIWLKVEPGIQSYLRDNHVLDIEIVDKLWELIDIKGQDGWYEFWLDVQEKYHIPIPSSFVEQGNELNQSLRGFIEIYKDMSKNAIRLDICVEKLLFELNLIPTNELLSKAKRNNRTSQDPSESIRLSWLAVEESIREFLVSNSQPEDDVLVLRTMVNELGFQGWKKFWSEFPIKTDETVSNLLLDVDGPQIRPLLNAYLLSIGKANLSEYLKRYRETQINSTWAEEAWVAANSIISSLR